MYPGGIRAGPSGFDAHNLDRVTGGGFPALRSEHVAISFKPFRKPPPYLGRLVSFGGVVEVECPISTGHEFAIGDGNHEAGAALAFRNE